MTVQRPRSVCDFLVEAAARHGSRPAVITDDESVTYERLAGRALQVAQVLRSASNNPRIALLADNGLDYAILYWGILFSGGTSVELNPGLGDDELRGELRNADPRLLLSERPHAPRLKRFGLPHTGTSVLVTCPGQDQRTEDSLATELNAALISDQAPPAAPPAPDPETLASIVYTSGTTGQVKGACLSHGNLAFVTWSIAESFAFGRDAPSERFAGNLPLYYTYGKSVLLLAAYLAAPIVFTQRFLSAQTLLDMIDSHAVTHLSLVPYYCNLLLRNPRFTSASLPQLRRITIAGGALHPEGLEEMLRRFPDHVLPMYGLTEASTRVTCMTPGERVRRPRSCGKAIPGVEIRIEDDAGRSPEPGDAGEVLVRGPNVMQGYFRDPDGTAATMSNDWLRSGDLGYLDSDGYLTISGRRKDVIKVMGESVSALSVEGVIAALPDVREVAVKGVPDATTGEAIAAFVVPREGADPSSDSIRRHCADVLGRSRVPAHIRFIEALPRTGSGKVRKHLLVLDA